MTNSSTIGRVYKLNWRGWIFPVTCLAIGTFETVGFLTGKLEPGPRFGMFGSVSLMIGGVVFAASAFTSKVILSDNTIEVRGIFYRNRMLFSEIRGRRETVKKSLTGISSSWKLEPREDTAHAIDINNFFTYDDVFYTWFNQIPDLDAEDVPEPCA